MAVASSTRRTITLFTTAKNSKNSVSSNINIIITSTAVVTVTVLITTAMTNIAIRRWWCWMGTMMMRLARKVEKVMVAAAVATPMGTECSMLKFKLRKLIMTTAEANC